MPLDPGGPNDQHADRYGNLHPGLNEPLRSGPGVPADEPLDKRELKKKATQLSELEESLNAREAAIRKKEKELESAVPA